MQPLPRARLAAGLGIAAMIASTLGCGSCGIGLALALPLAIMGLLLGRAVVVLEGELEGPESEASAWGRIAVWTSLLGGGFASLVTASSLIVLGAWSMGIGTLVAM